MARDYFPSVTIGSGGWMDFSFQEKTKTETSKGCILVDAKEPQCGMACPSLNYKSIGPTLMDCFMLFWEFYALVTDDGEDSEMTISLLLVGGTSKMH